MVSMKLVLVTALQHGRGLRSAPVPLFPTLLPHRTNLTYLRDSLFICNSFFLARGTLLRDTCMCVRACVRACVRETVHTNSMTQKGCPYFRSLTSDVKRYRCCEFESSLQRLSAEFCRSVNMRLMSMLIFIGVICGKL
jgi:hypothetical protein